MGTTTDFSIELLGGFALLENGQLRRPFPSRAVDAILAYVACSNTPVPRERLVNLIWENSEQKQASANLRAALSILRKSTGKFVEITRQHVSLQQAFITVDVLQFSTALQNITALTADQLEEYLSLYKGDFLAQFHLRSGYEFEEWVLIMRERLRRQAIEALQRLVHLRLAEGAYRQGLPKAAQWLQLDPYSESAHRQMMWFLLRTGQRNAALQQYEKCRAILEAEIDVEPTRSTSDLFYLIRNLAFPPPQQLPVDRSELIGRKTEITHLAKIIAAKKSRLITLLGPGGAGKTRLAVAVGQYLVQQKIGLFLHGTFFVSLTAVTSAAAVAQTIADTLDLQLGGDNPAKQLSHALADKELLLILDNFEQLLSNDLAVTLLTDLLADVPQLTLLITSRERLDLYQELIFDVTGLNLPQADETLNPQEFDAVKLFMQRAQQIHHDYQPASYDAIIETCRMVAGSPLAIELAASWVRHLTPREIADNVAESLSFLTSRYRDLPARHRSLQAVFDYSWQLLRANERNILAKLAVFSAEFDVSAAKSVAGATLAKLNTLADKSLLISRAGRFTLHALVRDFSYKQVSPTEIAKAEIKLVTYYTDWLNQQLDAQINSLTEGAVSAEINNIRHAWQLAITHNLPESLGTMLSPLFMFFVQRGRHQEGIDRISNALPLIANPAPFLIRRARCYIFLNDLSAAKQDLATTSNYPSRAEDAISSLGYRAIIHIKQEEPQAAQQLALSCLQAAKKLDDPMLTAFAYNLVGSLHKICGEYAEAQINHIEDLAIRRKIGDRTGEAIGLNNLGNLAQATGQYRQATKFYEQSSHLFKALNQPGRVAVTLSNAGRLAWLADDFEKAKIYLTEALAVRRKHGNLLGIAATALNLCNTLASLNQPTEAAQLALEIKQIVVQQKAIPYLLELYTIAAEIAALKQQFALQHQLLTYVLAQDKLSEEVRQLTAKKIDTLSQPLPTQVLPDKISLDTIVHRLLSETASGRL